MIRLRSIHIAFRRSWLCLKIWKRDWFILCIFWFCWPHIEHLTLSSRLVLANFCCRIVVQLTISSYVYGHLIFSIISRRMDSKFILSSMLAGPIIHGYVSGGPLSVWSCRSIVMGPNDITEHNLVLNWFEFLTLSSAHIFAMQLGQEMVVTPVFQVWICGWVSSKHRTFLQKSFYTHLMLLRVNLTE